VSSSSTFEVVSMIPANPPPRAAIAALNNAAWCDAVCRAHGGATSCDASAWMNAVPGPRFFPNLITLRAGAAPAVDLLDGKLGRQWSVKDSFADLDLRAHGFMPLFDAAWMWRGASPREIAPPHVDTLSWTTVGSPAGLVDWERAWEPPMGDVASARGDVRQFPAALLAHGRIVFVAGRIVAGGVLNADAGVVGVSTIFAQPADLRACWARLVDEAQARFPGLPQCTYDRAQPPDQPLAQGFECAGPLRIWVRQVSPGPAARSRWRPRPS
jgi:hypothetical protein